MIIVLIDTPGYGSVVDAQHNFDMFMTYISQTFEEKNKRISPFTEVSNNELMRSLVTVMSATSSCLFHIYVHILVLFLIMFSTPFSLYFST